MDLTDIMLDKNKRIFSFKCRIFYQKKLIILYFTKKIQFNKILSYHIYKIYLFEFSLIK